MPNHIHGIISITEPCRGVQLNAPNDKDNTPFEDKRVSKGVLSNAPTGKYFSILSPSSGTLGVIIRTYKSAFTAWCRKNSYENFRWQRNYYDRIIRNEKELDNIREYIGGNPAKWTWDKENPENINK